MVPWASALVLDWLKHLICAPAGNHWMRLDVTSMLPATQRNPCHKPYNEHWLPYFRDLKASREFSGCHSTLMRPLDKPVRDFEALRIVTQR